MKHIRLFNDPEEYNDAISGDIPEVTTIIDLKTVPDGITTKEGLEGAGAFFTSADTESIKNVNQFNLIMTSTTQVSTKSLKAVSCWVYDDEVYYGFRDVYEDYDEEKNVYVYTGWSSNPFYDGSNFEDDEDVTGISVFLAMCQYEDLETLTSFTSVTTDISGVITELAYQPIVKPCVAYDTEHLHFLGTKRKNSQLKLTSDVEFSFHLVAGGGGGPKSPRPQDKELLFGDGVDPQEQEVYQSFKYSYDGDIWTDLGISVYNDEFNFITENITIGSSGHETVWIKGTMHVLDYDVYDFRLTFVCDTELTGDSFNISVEGNMNSLPDVSFGGFPLTDASGMWFAPNGTYERDDLSEMFKDCIYLKYAPHRIGSASKPAPMLKSMFSNCVNLITPPELPAKILTSGCYEGMFYGCESLTITPKLSATVLEENCYRGMFCGCISLTTIPQLPATATAYNCFEGMFEGCDGLTELPALHFNTVSNYACSSMFSGCTNLTTVPLITADVISEQPFDHMFSDCSSLSASPIISATTINGIGSSMFSDCTSLRTASPIYADEIRGLSRLFSGIMSLTGATIISATTIGSYGLSYMFSNCTNLTVPPVLPMEDLSSNDRCYYEMFQNCTSLTTAPELPATELGEGCYQYMFSGCTSLTTAPELPATTLKGFCYSNMFYKCTSLTTAPELPATTLVSGCCASMFSGCTNLNYIKAMFTTTPSDTYTKNWVSGVASSGTFVKNSAASWTNRGTNAVPTNWTIETASE